KPRTVPGYDLLEELGHGGMGVVYRAWEPALKRHVALKMIRDGALARPEQRKRFHVEAESLARLQHPHIVQIFAIGEHEGQLFLVLELVEGGNLARRLDGTPLLPREAAELTATLAQAAHHAPQQGIRNRATKPANILLQRTEDRRKGTGRLCYGPLSSVLCPLSQDQRFRPGEKPEPRGPDLSCCPGHPRLHGPGASPRRRPGDR